MTQAIAHRPAAATGLPNRWPVIGLVVVLALMATSLVVPPVFGWDVWGGGVHPLTATWDPRVGPGTLPAIALGLAGITWGPRLAETLRWRVLLPAVYLAGAAWMVALATVDGGKGISGVLGRPTQFLPTARSTHDVSTMLHQFIGRIPVSAPHNWPTHVAGHPPGALLFFVGLVRIGLGGDAAAGIVTVVIAATTPVAVLLTMRRLGAETTVRRVAPFLVLGPAAIWTAVSADAIFAAAVAWGLCLLACAATTRLPRRSIGWGLAAGLLLGFSLFLSYGLALVGLMALAVLVAARRWEPLISAAVGVLAVVVAFAAAGFAWWHAYPVLSTRYWAGAAHLRPGAYWTWADLALVGFGAGPVIGPALATGAHRIHVRATGGEARTVLLLAGSTLLSVVLADASQMSRAEVERIWLPFFPWLLLTAALLPERWRHRALAAQIVAALLIQSLLRTLW